MTTICAVRDIEAQPETVWDILTDLDHYPNWNPYITALSGDLRVGGRLRATVHIGDRRPRAVTVVVTALEPARRLAWHSETTHELLLEPTARGTRFIHRHTLRGGLVLLLGPTFIATRDAVLDMNTALADLAVACQNKRADSIGERTGPMDHGASRAQEQLFGRRPPHEQKQLAFRLGR